MPQQLKAYLKAPEGRYVSVTERLSGTAFNSTRCTRLTYASLPDGPEQGEYIIFNLLDSLHICRYHQISKVAQQTAPLQPCQQLLVLVTVTAFQLL